VSWDPDIEDRNIDSGDNAGCDPFDFNDSVLSFGHHVYSVDDNLHETLYFKNPAK
jgi:hypothetical protein